MTFDAARTHGWRTVRDAESREWLEQLQGDSRTRNGALRRLHELLLKMAYTRLLPRGERLPSEAVDELALEAADQAVVRVLNHLDDFRGESRFTTWACQFAITEASVSLRCYRRQRREVPLEPELIVLLSGTDSSIDGQLERLEQLRAICTHVHEALTSRQREVLLALAVDGESPQTLAISLNTNAGALYKNLHDARRKLRQCLAESELTAADAA